MDSIVVSCRDVHMGNHSADVGTIQAQEWLVVEREQAFVEFEATIKFAENVRPLKLQ